MNTNETGGAAGEPVVVVNNLCKVFRDFWGRQKVRAVDGVSLRIGRGEIFGLLGPNGSGKSTTIKTILGLLYPTSGDVLVFGRSPSSVDTKRDIGYLPEESYLYQYLTPRETLTFYGRLFDLDAATIRRRTGELLEMVGLAHAADRPVGEFSKGMARRVGLAQALINDPKLVILDEPTSGLDPIACRQVKDLLLTLAKRGTTIIMSSHLLADVEDVCHRVAILYNGRVEACGSVGDLLQTQDRLRFTVPAVGGDVAGAIAGFIRQHTGSEPEVSHPSIDLEQFFLQVVDRAHRSATHESGAAAGGMKLAEYLKSDNE